MKLLIYGISILFILQVVSSFIVYNKVQVIDHQKVRILNEDPHCLIHINDKWFRFEDIDCNRLLQIGMTQYVQELANDLSETIQDMEDRRNND